MDMKSGLTRAALLATGLMLLPPSFVTFDAIAVAQTPAAAASQLGTVKEVSGNEITLTDKAGQSIKVSVDGAAKILQLAPGSTDLKTAQPSTMSEVAVGDRVLVTGKAGDSAGTFNAMRVILMKSADIAQKNAQEQADWQKRGGGGIVAAIPAPGTLTISAGAKKIQVTTTPSTVYRRYAGDSVKFEDAAIGTAAQIQVGDQLRVRGDKSDDGTSIKADEIVSGSFKNLAGTISKIDAASGTITMKDLATKKVVTVKLTANSAVHRLPERAAAMLPRVPLVALDQRVLVPVQVVLVQVVVRRHVLQAMRQQAMRRQEAMDLEREQAAAVAEVPAWISPRWLPGCQRSQSPISKPVTP